MNWYLKQPHIHLASESVLLPAIASRDICPHLRPGDKHFEEVAAMLDPKVLHYALATKIYEE